MGTASVFDLSATPLQRLIRTRAGDSKLVILTDHARVRMRQRRVVLAEVLDVLRLGRLTRTPEPNLAKGAMECRLERFVAGRELGVVAAVDDDRADVIVVTVVLIGE